jgi:outer membrane protein assembly factor BamB
MAFEDYATPVLASATLYSGSYALNANDGSTRFRLPQYTKPAAVDGGTLYTYTEDIVSAWNANTGVSLWSYKLPDDIGSVPVVANDVLYIGSIGGNSPPAMTPDGLDTFALNARTGNLLWRAATGIASSSPIVVGDTLYVGGFGPALFALDVATGHIRWRHDIGQSNFSTPVALGGTVYFTADGVYAVDAANGTLRWRQPGSADQSSWMDGLAHMNGMLYTSHTSGTSDGALYALSMSTGNTIWHVDGLNQPSPPVAAG